MNPKEQQLRIQKIQKYMVEVGVESLLLRSIPSFLYLTGTVMQGYIFLHQKGTPLFFLERPSHALPTSDLKSVYSIRKPEEIPSHLSEKGLEIGESTALELSQMPVTDYLRLAKLSTSGVVSNVDASEILRHVRMIKTEEECAEVRRVAERHMEIYRLAPDLFKPGMTDIEWQHEIEYQMRRRGSIGIFRAFGWRMEIFMGNLITGKSAEAPAPYDFTMGGSGTPAMPFGASGEVIRKGQTVMVDMAGNYGVYQTDITRTYALGEVPEIAQKAHQLSIDFHEQFVAYARPGAEVSKVYNANIEAVDKAGLQDYFMGTPEWKGKFVGHGLGIEINEPPVLTSRWKGTFEKGMVIAYEPKFVIPGVGPVGVENTYLITESGAENLTPLPMEIIALPEE